SRWQFSRQSRGQSSDCEGRRQAQQRSSDVKQWASGIPECVAIRGQCNNNQRGGYRSGCPGPGKSAHSEKAQGKQPPEHIQEFVIENGFHSGSEIRRWVRRNRAL